MNSSVGDNESFLSMRIDFLFLTFFVFTYQTNTVKYMCVSF